MIFLCGNNLPFREVTSSWTEPATSKDTFWLNLPIYRRNDFKFIRSSFIYKRGGTESEKAEFNNTFKYVKHGDRTVPNYNLEHRKVPTRIITHTCF